jgi:hypothetical protein
MAFNKTILTRAIRDVIKPKKLSKPKDVEFTARYAKDFDTSSNFKKLSVKPSSIHGDGLFADEFIKAGDPIMLSHVKHRWEENGNLMEEAVNTPYSYFYNHNEETPNAFNIHDQTGDRIFLVALADIQPGEEISSNYNAFDEDTLENPKDFTTKKNKGTQLDRADIGRIIKRASKKLSDEDLKFIRQALDESVAKGDKYVNASKVAKVVNERLFDAVNPASKVTLPGVRYIDDKDTNRVYIEGDKNTRFGLNVSRYNRDEDVKYLSDRLKQEADVLRKSIDDYVDKPYEIETDLGDVLTFDDKGFLEGSLDHFYHGVSGNQPGDNFNIETLEFDRSKLDPEVMKGWTSTGNKYGNSKEEFGFFGGLNLGIGRDNSLKYSSKRQKAIQQILKDPSKRPEDLGIIKKISLAPEARLVGVDTDYVKNAFDKLGINARYGDGRLDISGSLNMTPQKAAALKSEFGIDGIISTGRNEVVVFNPELIREVSDVPFKLFDYVTPVVQSMEQLKKTRGSLHTIAGSNRFMHLDPNTRTYAPRDMGISPFSKERSFDFRFGDDKLGLLSDEDNIRKAQEILDLNNREVKMGLRLNEKASEAKYYDRIQPFSEEWWKAAMENIDLIRLRGGAINNNVLENLDRFLKDPYESKKYSRSLAATNSVFAPNYLFSKPSKRRIYNPNAKYFEQGGNVSWNFKGKTYSGTLIPGMEDENNRYARTHNGKIKKLPKRALGGPGDPPTQADSLNVYNNAVKLKNFYDSMLDTELVEDDYNKHMKWSLDEFIEEMTNPETQRDVEKEHLLHADLSPANKAIIRGNKNPNISYISDIVTGAIDPRAPLAIYDKRIKPQGMKSYMPKRAYLQDQYLLNEVFGGNQKDYDNFTDQFLDEYEQLELQDYDSRPVPGSDNYLENRNKYLTDLSNNAYKRARSKIDKSKLSAYDKFLEEMSKTNLSDAPGAFTTVPFYDPIMVKPWSMLTEEEKEYRRKFKPKPKGTVDPKKSVNVNLIKLGLATDTKSANVVKKELYAKLFPDEEYKGKADQNTKLNKYIFDNNLAKEDIEEVINPSILPPPPPPVYDVEPIIMEPEVDRLPIIPPVLPSGIEDIEIVGDDIEEDFNNDYKAKRVVDKIKEYKEEEQEEQLYPEGFVPMFQDGGSNEGDPPDYFELLEAYNKAREEKAKYDEQYAIDLKQNKKDLAQYKKHLDYYMRNKKFWDTVNASDNVYKNLNEREPFDGNDEIPRSQREYFYIRGDDRGTNYIPTDLYAMWDDFAPKAFVFTPDDDMFNIAFNEISNKPAKYVNINSYTSPTEKGHEDARELLKIARDAGVDHYQLTRGSNPRLHGMYVLQKPDLVEPLEYNPPEVPEKPVLKPTKLDVIEPELISYDTELPDIIERDDVEGIDYKIKRGPYIQPGSGFLDLQKGLVGTAGRTGRRLRYKGPRLKFGARRVPIEEEQLYPEGFVPMFQDGGIPTVKQRKGVRKNSDGSESTHIMRAEYIPERGWVAFPSLFQDEDGTWVDMSEEEDWMKVYEEAQIRDEVYDFGEDKKSALAFGKGSWKKQLLNQDVELELTDEEIQKYVEGGYIVEEINS